jgi:hypothetical protein
VVELKTPSSHTPPRAGERVGRARRALRLAIAARAIERPARGGQALSPGPAGGSAHRRTRTSHGESNVV